METSIPQRTLIKFVGMQGSRGSWLCLTTLRPQQNVVVKRMNRSPIQIAKVIIDDLHLSMLFLGRDVVVMFTCHTTLKDKTPKTTFTRGKPNISHFGVYVLSTSTCQRRKGRSLNQLERCVCGIQWVLQGLQALCFITVKDNSEPINGGSWGCLVL